jgi:NRPS condensation-like uncharacterized protein
MGLVGRIHHAMADGVSAIHLASGLLFDDLEDSPAPRPKPHGDSPGPAPSSRRGALLRELRPGRDTMLDQHIGPGREVAWTTFPLERLKRIEHSSAESVTVNDVVLAVVAGGLRRWLPEVGGVAEDLRVQCPVCSATGTPS